jgi:hypothetical protein
MKMSGFVCVSVLLFLFTSASARAQLFGRGAGPGVTGLWHPIVGTAATYKIQQPNHPDQNFEFAVVGKETAQGKDAVWIEITMTEREFGNRDMVFKELVSFDPAKLEMQNYKAVVQMPGRPPMLMPDEMMANRQPFKFNDVRGDSVDLGSQSVTTPAGTFPCEHYRSKNGDGEFWVSEKVAPIGLVKTVEKDGQTTILVSTATNAKDKITSTPQPFDPMMFMPPNPDQ